MPNSKQLNVHCIQVHVFLGNQSHALSIADALLFELIKQNHFTVYLMEQPSFQEVSRTGTEMNRNNNG